LAKGFLGQETASRTRGQQNTKEVQLWLWKTRPWYAVIAGKSSLLLPVSKSSTYLMGYRMNLAAVRNVGLLGEENAGVAIISHDRHIPQSVLTVVWKPQCRFNPGKSDRSIAKSATKNIKPSQVSHLV